MKKLIIASLIALSSTVAMSAEWTKSLVGNDGTECFFDPTSITIKKNIKDKIAIWAKVD